MLQFLSLSVFLFIQSIAGYTVYPREGWTFYTPMKDGMKETIETLKKDHGIIVTEIYSMAGTMGSDCIPTKIGFSPFVDGLRDSVKDLFVELDGEGETAQETKILAKRRETLERVLKNQQKELERQMEYELSRYWGSRLGRSEYARTELSVSYETKEPMDLYHHESEREQIRENLEENLPEEIADLSFISRLDSVFRSYRRRYMDRFDDIISKLVQGEVPQEIFNSEEDIKNLVSSAFIEPYYEHSVYRLALFDALSMMSARTMSRPSKLEILTEICLDLYTDRSNQMLLKIETEPKLKENYYVQSVLPEYIVVKNDGKHFNMASTIVEDGKKNMIVGGIFCGKTYLLPEDCNILERKGCAHVVTPKKLADAPKLSEKTVKLARKNGQAAPKIEF